MDKKAKAEEKRARRLMRKQGIYPSDSTDILEPESEDLESEALEHGPETPVESQIPDSLD